MTLVGSLVFLGQEPHCVLEVPEKGDGRLLFRRLVAAATEIGIDRGFFNP